MVDKEFIRKKHFVEEWPIRKIARNLNLSRQCIRKALADSQEPHYTLTKPRPCPVMDPFREIILAWLKYDNLKTAVVKILAGPLRQEHTVFSSLRAHYLFDSAFCNPAQGHEKGSVENLVGYVRRNALVPVRDFRDWEHLNDHLLLWSSKEREKRQNNRVNARPTVIQAVQVFNLFVDKGEVYVGRNLTQQVVLRN